MINENMEINGIVLIDKSKGCTSHDVVYKIRKLMNVKKVGHTGTLDPMAEGVLPILLGKGTLCSKYLINHDKKYLVKLQLGIKTDTADSEGKIIEEKPVSSIVTKQNIIKVLKSFIGKQEQIPPIYSAIKVNGKKLYEYARQNKEVEIKPRMIEIYDINFIDYDSENKQIIFEVFCGKGTYIRSLCESIAIKLNTVGFMSGLKRIRVGEFKIENCISIEYIDKVAHGNIHKGIEKLVDNGNFISIEKMFEDRPSIELNDRMLQLFLNGVKLTQKLDDGIYRVFDSEKHFIGIGVMYNMLLKRDIVV